MLVQHYRPSCKKPVISGSRLHTTHATVEAHLYFYEALNLVSSIPHPKTDFVEKEGAT